MPCKSFNILYYHEKTNYTEGSAPRSFFKQKNIYSF